MMDTGDLAATDRVAPLLSQLLPALVRYGAELGTGPSPASGAEVLPGPASVPADGIAAEQVVTELSTVVEHGCHITAPGFTGFITTGASDVPAVAAAATAVAGGQRYLQHAFNALEWRGLAWLAEVCGLPADVHGVFSSGGSTAQLVALGAARQAAYERLGVDVAADGLPSTPRGRIYVSERGHRTIHRAAGVLGLGREAVVAIASDRNGRVDADELAARLRADQAAGLLPVAVVGIAGSTDTGSIDPLDELADIAGDAGCWFHVDGAYGLIAATTPGVAESFSGLERADSWIVDPHKWLATGVGVGATYVRDPELLTRAFAEGEAAYLEGSFTETPVVSGASQFDEMAGPWADQGVELSAPPRGVLVWSVLRELGLRGVQDRVARHVAFAAHVAESVRADPRLELLSDPQLSIVCFRPAGGPDRRTRWILDELRRRTPHAPSSTMVGGALAIRPCFINPRTTWADVDGLVDAVSELADRFDRAG